MKLSNLNRLLCLLLIGSLCIPMLFSCQSPNEDGKVTGGESTLPELETQPDPGITEWVLIRSVNSDSTVAALTREVRSFLKSKLGATVTVKTDDYADYEPADNRRYLLLGDTTFALSKKVKEVTEEGAVAFLFEGDTLAIYAADSNYLWVAVQNYFAEYYDEEEGLRMPREGRFQSQNLSTELRSGWALPFPSYDDGELSETLYSTGYGYEENKTPSMMHVVSDTTANEFAMYRAKMDGMGYKETYSKTIDNNIYVGYTDSIGTMIYAYYMTKDGKNGTARVIWDRSSNVTLEEFNYTVESNGKAEFFLFNLNTDSEDTLLIRLADNSWIIIDGAVTGHGTTDPDQKFADAMYEFMAKQSGIKEGEKLEIAAWHLTHAHRDHCMAMGAFVGKYHDRINVKRILANIPDQDKMSEYETSNRPQYKDVMMKLNLYFPDAMYLKAHTGMEIQLADVKFTVLACADELADYWQDNKELYETVWRPSYKGGDYQTYRTEYKTYDFNNSSMLTMIDVAGMQVLSLGDGFRADITMVPYYSLETLTPDILKVAHHYFNDELIPFYYQVSGQKKPLYVLVTHYNGNYSGNSYKSGWVNSLSASAGQYFRHATSEKIFGYKQVDGKLVEAQYDATFSWRTK